MMHPDYELMIARQEIDRRLRASKMESELRKALTRPPRLWVRMGQQFGRLADSVKLERQRPRPKEDCLNCGPV